MKELSTPLSLIWETMAAAQEVSGMVMHMFVATVCTM